MPQLHHNYRCLYLFTTLLWTIFFGTTLVLYQVIDAYPGMIKAPDNVTKARVYRSKEIMTMMTQMRQGDYRLVRPSPSEETEIEQHKYCTYKMNAFMMTLCTSSARGRSVGKMSVSLHKRGIAAEAIALCCTNQPQFRDMAANTTFMTTEINDIARSLLVGWSLAEGLLVLLEDAIQQYTTTLETAGRGDSGAVVAMAQAAEAVWIASFHHPTHIENFLKHGLIQELGKLIVTLRPEEFGHSNSGSNVAKLEWGYLPARAVMWACAALQNLAANYCDNDLGYCIWEWNHDDGQLVLDEETNLEAPHLADQARSQIMAVPDLLETLAMWVCQGPIEHAQNATYGWPSEANLWKDKTFNGLSLHLQSPTIVPWAAAGVFKNLLLGKQNEELQTKIKQPTLQQCLCKMRRSPDWLESSKSNEAIKRWSPDYKTFCPSVYDNCQDDDKWEHAESGENCRDYHKERFCVEYGNDSGTNGKTANEACCTCGGGYRNDNESSGSSGSGSGGSAGVEEETASEEAAAAAAAEEEGVTDETESATTTAAASDENTTTDQSPVEDGGGNMGETSLGEAATTTVGEMPAEGQVGDIPTTDEL